MNQYSDPAIVNWDNANKKLGRDITEKTTHSLFFKNTKLKTVRYLCLPAREWLYEKQMVTQYPQIEFQITGIERNHKVYEDAYLNMTKMKYPNATFDLQESSVSTFLANSFSGIHYDIVNLDWMGTLSKEKEQDLAFVFARNYSKKYLLKMTMGIIRTGNPIQNKLLSIIKLKAKTDKRLRLLLDLMETRSYNIKDLYKYGVPEIVSEIGKQFNKKVQYEDVVEYPSTYGHPQLVFFFTVTNL